jgi:hypothetical protein
MVGMKRFVLLMSCSAALGCAADLANVHNVYLLKMGKGLDQYLANQLTGNHVFQVVTDPKLADTVFTDQLGEGFQGKLEELFPTPEADNPEPKARAKKPEDAETAPLMTDTVNKLSNPASNSGFGRARGTVFLVDAKSRRVIWSAFEPAKDGSSQSLDRVAKEIVAGLKKDLNPKKK